MKFPTALQFSNERKLKSHLCGGDVPSIEIILRHAEALAGMFGGHVAEVSIIQRPDAWAHLDQGLYAYNTDHPVKGACDLGPTEVDYGLATNGHVLAALMSTWREHIGQPTDFPLHALTDVERAIEAEIPELRTRNQQHVVRVSPQLPLLDAELRGILGSPNFDCIQIAARIRQVGSRSRAG